MRHGLGLVVCLAGLVLLLVFALLTPVRVASASRGPLEDNKLYVMTSIPVIADIASNVAGDRAWVESLVRPGVNVYTYKLIPSDSVRISESDLFIYVGYGAEEALGLYAEGIKDGVGVVSLSELLSESMPSITVNPYFWLDPLTTKELVYLFVDLFSTYDPEGRAYYLSNAERYAEKLDKLHNWVEAMVSRLPPEERKLVSVRDTLRYYALRYGFKVVGYVTPAAGTYEPSTKHVVGLLENMASEGVGVVFIEYEESSTTLREVIETIASEIGIRTREFVYIESLAPEHGVNTYLDLVRANTLTIIEGLEEAGSRKPGSEGSNALFNNPVLEPFKYEFMRRGALTLMLTVITASIVGSFAVMRGWAIFGDALGHGAIAGLLAAYLFSIDFFLGALASGLVVALIISSLERRLRLRTDVIIAVTFTSMFSLAVAVLSSIGGVNLSLEDILYADVTAVSTESMIRTVSSSVIVILLSTLTFRSLLAYSVDPVGAISMGFRTGALHYSLLLLLAVTVVSAFMAIGAIPAIASLIIPPATAYLISRRPVEFVLKSVLVGVTSSLLGFYISYYLGTNAGAATTLVAAMMFGAASVYYIAVKKQPFPRVSR